MSVSAPFAARSISPEELLDLPDRNRYELLDGELVVKVMSEDSNWIGGRIQRILGAAIEDAGHGWVYSEGAGYRCFADSGRIRRADASFVSIKKRPHGPETGGYIEVPPDLAVEVVSPHDLAHFVNAKAHEWLAAGVPVVWVVMPPDRTVTIYRDGHNPVVLSAEDEITLDAIPTFRRRVADFFPPGGRPAGA